ncbi:GIN domain-containing protein [Solitalea lacus]|uniref:GIN domain-containing protein n=1 Tax=Solitalea lacus TaxID=2911172 RepID=UPI001ED9E505|nr:DUF2807 domain-containing protein [Solitalea lacus]UKJ05836.1 DUF2807 domain-containing protein [Solitalea lacus]
MKTLSKLFIISCVTSMTFFWAGNAMADNCVKPSKTTQQLKQFSKLKVQGNVRVVITNAEKDQITILSKEEFKAQKVSFALKNGELVIKSLVDPTAETPSVLVFAKDLSDISLTDNAQIESLTTFSALSLSIKLEGASVANLSLAVFELSSHLMDCSSLNVKGWANSHDIRTDRSACVDGSSFIVNNYNAEINGICSFKAIVKEQFNYINNTASKIVFAGNSVSISTNQYLY